MSEMISIEDSIYNNLCPNTIHVGSAFIAKKSIVGINWECSQDAKVSCILNVFLASGQKMQIGKCDGEYNCYLVAKKIYKTNMNN